MEKSERLDMNLHLNFSQTSPPEVPVTRGSLKTITLSIPSLTFPVRSLFKTSKSQANPRSQSCEIPIFKNLRRCLYSIAR